MFTTTHKLAAVIASVVTALTLGVGQGSAARTQPAPTFSQPGVADLDW